MLVSILIPCYNAERWVAQAIESALAQTWLEKEVIVVDDGSTDGSLKVIKRFADRIHWETGRNRGGNVTRNRLTALARGEWLQYLDADDYLLPGKLASQGRRLLERGSVDVIHSPVICRDTSLGAEHITKIDSEDEALNFIQWAPFQTTGMLFRREAVLSVGGWKEDQPCCQEHELLWRLLAAGSRFAVAEQPGAVYQFHGRGSVSRRDPLRVIRTRMELTDRAAQHLESSGALTAAHRKALFIARMESARSAYASDPELAEQLCAKAFAQGWWWPDSSPALPLGYQIMLWAVGFRRAERIAARVRELR